MQPSATPAAETQLHVPPGLGARGVREAAAARLGQLLVRAVLSPQHLLSCPALSALPALLAINGLLVPRSLRRPRSSKLWKATISSYRADTEEFKVKRAFAREPEFEGALDRPLVSVEVKAA